MAVPTHNENAAAFRAVVSSPAPSDREITDEAPTPNRFASAVSIIMGGKLTPIAATRAGSPTCPMKYVSARLYRIEMT